VKFTPCPEFLADVLSTPVNFVEKENIAVATQVFISQAAAHMSLRPNCGP